MTPQATKNEPNWPRKIIGGMVRSALEDYKSYCFSREVKHGKLRPSSVQAEMDIVLKGSYLATSEKGLFHLKDNRICNIFPYYTFGVSVFEDYLYSTVSIGGQSYVICVYLKRGDGDEIGLGRGRILYYLDTLYHNERFHQIHVRNGIVAVANTRRNSVTTLHAKTGELLSDIYPLTDGTGFPIHADHNHINSVYIGKDCLLFTAHNGGNIGSLIGCIYGDKIYAFPFQNRGVHDIIPTRKGIVFSDTFGSSLHDFRGGGDLFYCGRWMIGSDLEKGYMVRGVSGTENEIVVGHSFMGKREDRFKGRGGVLVFRDGDLAVDQEVPFSQVNDVVRVDGAKLDDEWSNITGAEALTLLEGACGKACYENGFSVRSADASDFKPGSWI